MINALKHNSVIAIAALVLLTAMESLSAQDSWNNVLQAGGKEGSVILYASLTPATIQRVSSDFQRAFPAIRLEVSRSSGGPLLSKIDQERQTSTDGADVLISTDMGWLEARAAEKMLIVPAGPASVSWPVQYLIAGAIVVGSLEPFVIAYNTNVAKSALRGYRDLLSADYRGGKLGVSDISSSTTIVAFYDWLERTVGGDILANLAGQKPRIYPGTVTPTQAVAAGEIYATVASNPASIRTLIEQGAPIKYAVPNPARGFATAWPHCAGRSDPMRRRCLWIT